jgi:hypothetical protein
LIDEIYDTGSLASGSPERHPRSNLHSTVPHKIGLVPFVGTRRIDELS